MIQSFDDYEFDANKLELRRAGRPIKADRLLLRILRVLVRRPGDLITKHEIVAEVWDDRAVSDNALSVSMARLRKLLGHERSRREMVLNVHGRGYRFMRPVTTRDEAMGPALATAAAGRVGTPFVGRARVLTHLRESLQDAAAGSGSLSVLSGEAGIGKTRVVEVLAREAAASGLPVAWGYCREVGDAPALWPLTQIARELIHKLGLDPALLRPELRQLLPDLQEQAAEPAGRGCSIVDAHTSKHRIFDAIAGVLTLAAERSPCLLILDDLHRADPASLEFLHYFVDELASTRTALFATLRSDEPTGPHFSYVIGHRNTRRIALSRLSHDEVASYLGALVGEERPALAHALFVKSEGNPFFMTELARQIKDAEQGATIERLRLPYAALDLVRQRVARLDAAARGALSQAAVIGRQFSLPVLQAITGRDADTLMQNLDHALESGVVHVARDSATSFEFSHELLRAVLYDGLTPAERRACHFLTAQALEQRVHAGEVWPAAELAYHFRSALPAGDPRKAVRHCIQAGQDASRVYAYADGARYFRQAREALDLVEHPSASLRVRLLLQQALLLRAHSALEFEPLIREVISAARSQGFGVQLAYAGLLLGPYRGFPAASGSRAVLEEARTLLPESDLGTRAAVEARLASIPPLAYNNDQARALLQRAREQADASELPLALYNVRMAELYLTHGPRDRAAAADAMREIERLCRTPGLSMTVQAVLLEAHRAVAALQDGELPSMYAALDRGLARSQQLDPDLHWLLLRMRALARIHEGDTAGGTQQLMALVRPEHSNRAFASDLLCAADACLISQTPDSLPREQLLTLMAADPDDPPNIWALKIRTLSAAGYTSEARRQLAEVPAMQLAALPCDRDYLGTLGALTRSALALDARDYLEALTPLLAPYADLFATNIAFYCEGAVSQLLGLIAARLGRHVEAQQLLTEAISASERHGLHACAAQARLELALCRASRAS
ncbi:MAG TPA: AAA family ATPase [Polyangiales bacterium]|nr:AAA family ATPase [Polyangiales bacterium]